MGLDLKSLMEVKKQKIKRSKIILMTFRLDSIIEDRQILHIHAIVHVCVVYEGSR
jgi:hypothetical protein